MRRILNASIMTRRAPGLLTPALLATTLLSVGCHSHDDNAGSGGGGGTSGIFTFSSSSGVVRQGQLADFQALLNGASANIVAWDLVNSPGGSLLELSDPSAVRFIAGDAGVYFLQATDDQNRTDTYQFQVLPTGTDLVVSEVIAGTDADGVAARLTTGGGDHFIADRIGGPAAPQNLARADRAGDRIVERTLAFKIQDIAADELGNLTATRTATTLTDALVRFDRDLVESTTFSAPDLGGAAWSDFIAVTRDGVTVVATDLNGGSLVRLDLDGNPVGGSLAASALPLPLAFADVVDLTAGLEGEVYVASETEIARVLADGTVDTTRWAPATQVAIRAMDADHRGVLHVALQDADGGQCGSIRQLDWIGGQIRRYSDFTDPSAIRFAARKVLDPRDICAFGEGSWRLYDDTVTLNPATPTAAWIVAGDVPQDL